MKRSLYILLLGGIWLLVGSSCKKEKLISYNASDNIYFNFVAGLEPTRYSDSLVVTFAFSNPSVEDTVIYVPIAITGVAADHDRSYSVSVDANSTAVASTDYVLPSSFVVRASKIADSIAVRFKRTVAMKTASVFLTLRLRENDQFKTQIRYRSRQANDLTVIAAGDTIGMQTFKLIVSDMLAAGPYWDEYSYYFGDFSEKKVRLINQIVGMPLDFWSTDLYGDNYNTQFANTLYYAGFTFRYLTDQAYQGNTIFEADGVTPMTMGYYFQ